MLFYVFFRYFLCIYNYIFVKKFQNLMYFFFRKKIIVSFSGILMKKSVFFLGYAGI